MSASFETIYKQILPLKVERVNILVVKLIEDYRRVRIQIQKETSETLTKKFQCTLQGLKTGFRYVELDDGQRSLNADGFGEENL